jgi:hypothetical protein
MSLLNSLSNFIDSCHVYGMLKVNITAKKNQLKIASITNL